MANILIVDDDITFTLILKKFLGKHHFIADVAHSKKDGLQKIVSGSYDLFLLDYRLSDGTGLDLFMEMPRSSAAAIIMTSLNDVRTAVKAMRMGVYDYITKPVNQDELLMIVQQALADKQKPASETSIKPKLSYVEGVSAAYQKLNEQVALIAPTDMSVLVHGESGTGKEFLSRQIHNLSKRADAPFVAIDCGTLNSELSGSELFGHVRGAFTTAVQDKKGLLEEANRGTLFLDEIGNLNMDVQKKLLRVLQEKTVQPVGSTKEKKIDIRLIAATNEDLRQMVQQGKFREDLYHRLNEFKLMIPPLRERTDDLALFIQSFVEESNRLLGKDVKSIAPEVMKIFNAYEWPGNIRELKNIIKRMVLLSPGKEATVSALPEEMLLQQEDMDSITKDQTDLKKIQESQEKRMIEDTLKKVNFNKAKAARILNIDRSTLYAKMEKYGISV
jgi:two-component system, NtrC family, response regulator HydG